MYGQAQVIVQPAHKFLINHSLTLFLSTLILFGCTRKVTIEVGNKGIDAALSEGNGEMYNHLTTDDAIRELVNHPAFKGFGALLLPRDPITGYDDTQLRNIGSLIPYHNHVDPDIVVDALNHMIDETNDGRTIFYDFYTKQEIKLFMRWTTKPQSQRIYHRKSRRKSCKR